FVKDVARDDNMASFGGEFAEQRDGFGADQRIESIERFVENENSGIVRNRLRKFDPLPHPFAVSGNLTVRSFDKIDALDCFPRLFLAFGVRCAEQSEEGVDELESGEPLGKGIELRRIAEQ